MKWILRDLLKDFIPFSWTSLQCFRLLSQGQFVMNSSLWAEGNTFGHFATENVQNFRFNSGFVTRIGITHTEILHVGWDDVLSLQILWLAVHFPSSVETAGLMLMGFATSLRILMSGRSDFWLGGLYEEHLKGSPNQFGFSELESPRTMKLHQYLSKQLNTCGFKMEN
jgi:hypothetical protein